MLLRRMTEFGCLICAANGVLPGANTISAAVGRGGANKREDVKAIQRLLNGVKPQDGGPTPILIEDGFIGPLTDAAILRFQTAQNIRGRTGGEVRDDRIDPNGPTLRQLRQLSTPAQRAAALGAAGSARLARVGKLFSRLQDAARAAERAAEQARDFVQLGQGSLFPGGREPHYRRAEFYFAFAGLANNEILDDLGFIRTTLTRIVSVLGGPSPFGLDIFDNDPSRDHPDWLAFSPTQTGAESYNDGTTPLRIYLCDGIDQVVSDDKFAHILMHELFHFVDDEAKETRIFDAPKGYRDGALRLTHAQRMHNADNYALFVTHTAIGRARLVASQPSLGPLVPAGLV